MAEGPASISIPISLAPNPHHYSSPAPPTLSVTATSHASRPLTILTWHTLLHPDLALRQSAFAITDLTTGTPAAQTTVQLSRAPFRRRAGSPDDHLFLTLFPDQPATVTTPFGYPVEPNGPPRPEGHPRRMRESARGMIPRRVCGVDGLVAGRRPDSDVGEACVRFPEEPLPDFLSKLHVQTGAYSPASRCRARWRQEAKERASEKTNLESEAVTEPYYSNLVIDEKKGEMLVIMNWTQDQ